MNGKFGLGFTQTLGGVSGISARYWATRKFGIEGDFGFSVVDRAGVRASNEFLMALGIYYALVQSRDVNLLVGLRVDLGIQTAPNTAEQLVSVGRGVNTETQSTTAEVGAAVIQPNIEIPVQVEYFLNDTFAINLSVGIVVVIAPEEGAILESSSTAQVVQGGDIGVGLGAGGFLGSAGFTFYF